MYTSFFRQLLFVQTAGKYSTKPCKRRKYKIKWLEEVGQSVYNLSYEDFIEKECILDVVILVNRRSRLILAQSEHLRIQKLAELSNVNNVEQTWDSDSEVEFDDVELTEAASNDDENITDIERDTIDGVIEDVHKTKQTEENDEETQKNGIQEKKKQSTIQWMKKEMKTMIVN